ncbi:unnamed protein product [Owenia fusiformis]|uniref:Gamma-soluble NSF attachment protein n=1 Tax=Owenia fusiformis TaxID=6347 RepID=A0A8J1UPS2_OWEFU|nr:unnamed protein product [Owenia fusiformis]
MANKEKKISEGLEHMELAAKCLKTSFFKWKPDLDGAVSEYGKAAVCFKNGKALEKAREAYIKTADTQCQANSHFHAGKSYEQAAMICRDMKDHDQAAHWAVQASNFFLEYGTPDTACSALERAGKMIEPVQPEKAIELYRRAQDVAEMEDRPRQAAEMAGKVARIYIRLKKHEQAYTALEKEMTLWSGVENFPMVNKLVVAAVLLQLHLGDYIAADKMYKSSMSVPGFGSSEEAMCLEELLTAYDEGDQEKATEVLRRPIIRYMENDFTKLARDLTVPGGRVGTNPNPTDGAGETVGDDEDDEYSGGLC